MPIRVGHAVLDRIPACTWDVEGVLYWLLACPCDVQGVLYPASLKDESGFDHGEDSKQASLAYVSYIHV